MKNILILGGSGFIGKNLIQELAKDSNLYIINFDQHDFSDSFPSNVRYFNGNLRDLNSIKACFELYDIDLIIHLISTMIPGSSKSFFEQEFDLVIKPTYTLLELMKEYRINKLIFISSGGTIYGKSQKDLIDEEHPLYPINYYGYSKLILEKYITMSNSIWGLKYFIIRPSNVYGIGCNWRKNQGVIQKFIYNTLIGKPIEIWGDGKVIRDYIYIEDFCRAIHTIINNVNFNQIFNIGSGKGYSILEIADIVLKKSKQKSEIIFKEGRKVDVPRNVLDISKIVSISNWAPKIGIEEGISLTFSWIKQQLSKKKISPKKE